MIAKIENILNESKASIYIADGLENPIDNPLLHRHFKNEGESCLIPFHQIFGTGGTTKSTFHSSRIYL